MIRFSFYKYTLQPMTAIGALASDKPRQGALIKCVWPDGKIGYSDCYPWPELGDAELDVQLMALSRGRISFLVEQSIWLARKDAMLRSMKKSGLDSSVRIKNHYLINDLSKVSDLSLTEIKSSGFTTLKIKVGKDSEADAQKALKIIKSGAFNIRFDFNSKGNFSEFERFMTIFDARSRTRIEYVEDPFPFEQKAWAEASQMATLAADVEYENVEWSKEQKPPFKIIVIKPARQDVDKAVNRATTYDLKMVVTSSLDHPVGVIHSIVIATEIKKAHPNQLLDCGCMSLRSYKSNEFSHQIMTQGPYFSQIKGTGIGFDEILEGLPWIDLKKE